MPQATAALEDLFAQFAPIFEVGTASDEDRIGALRWSSAEVLEVDTGVPTVYHYLSYARFGGLLLPQLNYTIWFPERALEGSFDLFGGHLDGMTWRVTLDVDGGILVADAIHNCGCYHLFFPLPRVRLKPQPATLEEIAFVPQTLPIITSGQSLLVRIARHTHFVERVLPVEKTAGGIPYLLADYDAVCGFLTVAREARSAPMGLSPGRKELSGIFIGRWVCRVRAQCASAGTTRPPLSAGVISTIHIFSKNRSKFCTRRIIAHLNPRAAPRGDPD